MDYSGLGVKDFLKGVKNREINLDEFYSRLFPKLRKLQKEYNFFVTLAREKGLDKKGKGRLKGLPVSVKDNICTEGLQTTAGSRILEGYRPPFDAAVIESVRRDGGIVIGKTQMDEFGFGTFSVNSGFGVPKNPLDPRRSCGGSSGGAAGLTQALDLPHIALAESTGGSISCPASFCGVVGLTPTYGIVSRWGLIDYANSLDKIGLIAKKVEDAALLLERIQGFDSRDFTSLKTLKRGYSRLEGVKGMKIGVPKEYLRGVDPKIRKHVWDAVHFLEGEGARYKEVSLPKTKFALASYYIIATAEASTNLARYCGMRYGSVTRLKGNFNQYFSKTRSKFFGEEAKRRVILGTFVRMAGFRSQYYQKAFKVRSLIIRDFENVFRGRGACDVLMVPTMPIVAPKFKEIERMKPAKHYQMDALTVGPNLAGIPQLTVPFGKSEGMPVGVHILGDHLQERKILRVGKVLEAR